jgi:HK97 family phage portal protein
MAIVRSFGSLQSVGASPRFAVTSTTQATVPYSWAYSEAYAAIYASQPAVRTCVDFLARNVAQLGLHVFRRVSDTDRVRLTDHPVADWLSHPNPFTTQFRLIESLIADLALYFNAFWLKVRTADDPDRVGLVRIPPSMIRVEGGLLPQRFIWTVDGQESALPTSAVVFFNGYNPTDPNAGLSPIETLRGILEQDAAAADHRTKYWLHASRIDGIIERPLTAPRWTVAQRDSWREQWQAKYAGPISTGRIPVLEEGMTFRPTAFNAQESEYAAARKLSLEEIIRIWHIPPPMVGDLDHATFSNIKEQHKQLYADCLGPWCEMVQAGIELQLLPEARDNDGIYIEFNIAEKLKGSFEEQATGLRMLVGRPLMTPNEGRARLNLPRIVDDPSADQLAAQQGGPAAAEGVVVPDAAAQAATATIVRAHLQRQASRLARYPADAKAEALNVGRCISELHADLTSVLGHHAALDAAVRVTDQTYTLLLEGRDAFAADREVCHAA